MWTCESCGADVPRKRILCPQCGNGAPFADAEQVALATQRDLVQEAHVRAIGILFRIGAVACGGLAVMVTAAGVGVLANAQEGVLGLGRFLGGVVFYLGMFLVALGAASWALGHYLGRFANGARITAGVLALVSLVMVGVRTVFVYRMLSDATLALYGASMGMSTGWGWLIGYLVLGSAWYGAMTWTLFSRRSADLCSYRYRTLVARTPEVRAPWFKSPYFILPVGVTVMAVLMFSLVLVRQRLS